MEFDAVREALRGIPYMPPETGRLFYDFILETRPQECLELGFAHGVSTCYMAAALDELGTGRVTAVDLLGASFDPTLEDLVRRLGLAERVEIHREASSYTWFLKRMIEARTTGATCRPMYDFCFIDGAKNWTIDGLAFFLVDKLLKDGGWIVFDDLNWTYEAAGKAVADGVTVRALGADERIEPHVARIFELLVQQHPAYGEFRIVGDQLGWARKHASAIDREKVVRIVETGSLRDIALRSVRRAVRRARRRTARPR